MWKFDISVCFLLQLKQKFRHCFTQNLFSSVERSSPQKLFLRIANVISGSGPSATKENYNLNPVDI